jgi:hypothetical protein
MLVLAFLIPLARLPKQRCESVKDIPVRVQNEHQCVRVAVASVLKTFRAETVVISSPQKHKPFPVELVEKRRKGRNDSRIQMHQHFQRQNIGGALLDICEQLSLRNL